MPHLDRRTMIAATLAAAPPWACAGHGRRPAPCHPAAPDDEAYWAQVAALYDRPAGVIQLSMAIGA
jgi:hypothetical protein